MAVETTLVLVKPDGMQRRLAGEILMRFERRGLELRGARLLKIPRALAQQHYGEHKGKPFYGDLVSFITSGPVLALAVRGESAISVVRTMMGATQPARLRSGHDPRRLRARALREHRPRLGLQGEREARAGAVLPRRPGLDPVEELNPDAAQNRAFWDGYADEYHERNADFIAAGLAWGLWQIPESELQVLGDVAGKDVLELGCGAAEWSRALLAAGARPVGLDNSEKRLDYARRLNEEAGVDFPLVHASAECGAARGRLVRHRHVRLGRDDVRRPVPDGARGRTGPAARWPLRLQRQRATRLGVLQRGRGHVRRSVSSGTTSACTAGTTARPSSSTLTHGEWVRLFRQTASPSRI